MFFSLRVERRAPLPDPPFVMAANHYSHFDPPAIAAALDMPIRYLGLVDLFAANRLVIWLIEGFGTIPTQRFKLPMGALRMALEALEDGEVVGVFPEATRVSHWGVVPPRRGAAWLAQRVGVPLVPVAVLGTGRALGLENRLRRAPIRIVVGEPIEPSSVPDLTETWAAWIGEQVERFPDLEVEGPRRAATDLGL